MDTDVINLAKAIRKKESGDNFNAVGDNGTSTGAYQWQAATWKEHARQVLGNSNAEKTPANQNAVAYGMIKSWKDQGLNPAQIAAKWNSGSEKGWENKIGTTTINGKPIQYNVPQYVKDVTDNYRQFKGFQEPSVGMPMQQFGAQPIPLDQMVGQQGVGGNVQNKEPGFFSNLVNDPFKTLIAQPAVKLGQAVGGGIVNMFGDEASKQRFAEEVAKPTTMPGIVGDITIQGQKNFGEGGGKQITGDALKSASYLMPLERAGTIASKFATGQVGKGLLSGAAQGVISGGMYGGGQAMTEGAGAQDILKQAGVGAAIGGVTGGLVSGAVPAVVGAANKVATALPRILSYTSDVPEAAFNNLLKNRVKVAPLIGKVDDVTALDTTRGAVRNLRKTLTQEWQEGTDNIIQEFTGQRIDLSGKLGKALDDVADDFGLENIPQNVKNVSAKEAMELLREINSLPQAVLTFSPKGAKVRALKDALKVKVIKTFGGDSGSVANLYKNYSIKKSVFDAANDIVNAYNKNKPIRDTTAMNRLQKIFDENKPAYLDAILALEKETGIDVLSTITASKFKKVMPSSMSNISSAGGLAMPQNLLTKILNLLAFPLTSPRVASFITRRLPTDIPVRMADAVGAGSITKDVQKAIEAHKNAANKQGGFIKNGMDFNELNQIARPVDDLPVNITPEKVAKKLDKQELSDITEYLRDDSVDAFAKIEGVIDAFKLDTLKPDVLKKFFFDVISESLGIERQVR